MQQSTKPKSINYVPYDVEESSNSTPDCPEFYKVDINMAIFTKYGRYIYIRHGNEEKCSSFFATLTTIVNKLQLSFGEQVPANLKKIVQGNITFIVLKRDNFMYIAWMKTPIQDDVVYSAIQFTHYQLMSSLTAKVNKILDTNQTYDPSVNFGKTKTIYNMLNYSIVNGLYSTPLLFNCIPILPLSAPTRNSIYTALRDKRQEGLKINLLMSYQTLVSCYKRKSIDLDTKDILLLFNLLQSQASLSRCQNWFPICLPGLDPEIMVFCYMCFIGDLVHVVISDDADIFPSLSQYNKELKAFLQDFHEQLSSATARKVRDDPLLDRMSAVQHFIIINKTLKQMVSSDGTYYGKCPSNQYMTIYGHMLHHYYCSKSNRKEKLHIQTYMQYVCAYFADSNTLIFIIMSILTDIEEAKNVIMGLLKYANNDDNQLFIPKLL